MFPSGQTLNHNKTDFYFYSHLTKSNSRMNLGKPIYFYVKDLAETFGNCTELTSITEISTQNIITQLKG